MINTCEIPPSPELAPYIRCYTLREFDTMGQELIRPYHASYEISMGLFFKALPIHIIGPKTRKILKKGSYGSVLGLGTQYNGEQIFNGVYTFFQINFRSNGFYQIFKIPSHEILDQIIDGEDILDPTFKTFYENLGNSTGLSEMSAISNEYFLCHLNQQKSVDFKDRITYIYNSILKNPGYTNIEKMAYKTNMSKRNFERCFTQHVGMSPKLFSCVSRFNQALTDKIMYPKKE